MKESTQPTHYKENDHWRVNVPAANLRYPRRVNHKHFKSEADAKAVLETLEQEHQKQVIEAARRWANVIEIPDNDFREFFNASITFFPKNEAVKNLMLSILTNHSTLIIRNK
jgi:hypothetical protein